MWKGLQDQAEIYMVQVWKGCPSTRTQLCGNAAKLLTQGEEKNILVKSSQPLPQLFKIQLCGIQTLQTLYYVEVLTIIFLSLLTYLTMPIKIFHCIFCVQEYMICYKINLYRAKQVCEDSKERWRDGLQEESCISPRACFYVIYMDIYTYMVIYAISLLEDLSLAFWVCM